jgi:hypothetical protein
MRIVPAMDVSDYSGPITGTQARRAYDMGIRLAIVQLWGGRSNGTVGPNRLAVQQLSSFHVAGCALAGYFWLPPDTTTKTHSLINSARDAADTYWSKLLAVAPDIEAIFPTEPLHPTKPEARLADAIANVNRFGKDTPIYTSRYMWSILMRNSDAFGDYLLWEAFWDRDARLHVPDTYPPGWDGRTIKQYTGSTNFAGIHCCLDVADLDALNPSPPPDPEAALHRLVDDQLATWQRFKEAIGQP